MEAIEDQRRREERGLPPLHPSCYYLYGIAKHASGNQHEIVNCSAHLCVAQGTGAFRRSCIERRRVVRVTACKSGPSHDTQRRLTNILSPLAPNDLHRIAVAITRGTFHVVRLRIIHVRSSGHGVRLVWLLFSQ